MNAVRRQLGFLLLWLSMSTTPPLQGATRTVAYLTLSHQRTPEDSATIAWLVSLPGFRVSVVTELSRLHPSDIVWCHIPDSVAYSLWPPLREQLQFLEGFYRQGGKLLFTDFGALLPHEIGMESVKPEVRTLTLQDDWLFDEKGLQSFRGHPAFHDLFGGTFLWDPDVDQRLPMVGYFGGSFPKEGKVVGVDKSYVFLHSDQRLMVEYRRGKGRALSIGSFVYFSRRNSQKKAMERFVENSLRYLAGEAMDGPVTYWQQSELKPRAFSVRTTPIEFPARRWVDRLPSTELLLQRAHPRNDFFDVAGRRVLMMGFENGGIDEVWVHPLRVLRNFEAGIVTGDSISWLRNLPVRLEVRPESFTRYYTTPLGDLKEVLFPSLSRAGGLVHYESEGRSPIQMVVKFRTDLRWMWPYDERALGDVYFGYDEGLGAFHVKDTSGDFYCIIGGNARPRLHFSGQCADITWKPSGFTGRPTDVNQVYHAALYDLDGKNRHSLALAIAGTDEGEDALLRDYRFLLSKPEQIYAEMVRHYRNLLKNSVTIESPDKEFNQLFMWALVGTDRFVVTTPRLGTALTAGYSTTARGWNGEHTINGRPGYGWYFGRDSEWSGFAIDDYGDFATVRQQLEFLQKYQDVAGKIFHELSTSGVVHYDASDATPLYIILAAHYLRASGDLEFVRTIWPSLRKAMEFLSSTDTDGDGLIENTNVGHGWVEGGKLWPVHTEFYLAGLWGQALGDAAFIAAHLKEQDASRTYASAADRVRKALNEDFWNPSTLSFNYGKLQRGGYNPEPTSLAAVVMHFGLLDDEKVEPMLSRYAGNGFSSDWGVRIVSSESPLFNPTGYHYGSIWPLFTGWTALAEYQYGRSVQGFTHLINNMYIKNHWALGFVEEVMNGAVYEPGGVCPHQCWSETNILHPAITGMVGWRPSAVEGEATLRPRFPLQWDSVTVNNLRVGRSALRMAMQRGKNSTRYRFHLVEGEGVRINFAPEVPEGMIISGATLNNRSVQVSSILRRGCLADPITVDLRRDAEVTLSHTGGIGVIPLMPRPSPGDTSRGYRIVRGMLNGSRYTIDLEGRSGTTASFAVRLFDQTAASVDGGENESGGVNDWLNVRVTFSPSSDRYIKHRVTVHLK